MIKIIIYMYTYKWFIVFGDPDDPGIVVGCCASRPVPRPHLRQALGPRQSSLQIWNIRK